MTPTVKCGHHVALFGTFDGVHDGHRDLFRQARKYGGRLSVIIARDWTVRQLKHKCNGKHMLRMEIGCYIKIIG